MQSIEQYFKTHETAAPHPASAACPAGSCCVKTSALPEQQAAQTQCTPAAAPTASTCKPLSKTQLLAFQEAIVQQEVGAGGCTLANGGCQDNVGDPAAPEQFTSSQLSTPSGYTPISLGASGGAAQDLYYRQVSYLLQNETNAKVQKNCGSSLPAQDQPMPSQATLQAAKHRAHAVERLFNKMPSWLGDILNPKLLDHPTPAQKGAYAELQAIIQDAQGSKKKSPVDQSTMDQLVLNFSKYLPAKPGALVREPLKAA